MPSLWPRDRCKTPGCSSLDSVLHHVSGIARTIWKLNAVARSHSLPGALLLPLTVDFECCPIIGRSPLLCMPHLDLCFPQSCRRSHLIVLHRLIEIGHQIGCSHVTNIP